MAEKLPSIRSAAAAILATEVERLAVRSESIGLEDKDVTRLQKLLALDNEVHAAPPAAAAPDKADIDSLKRRALEKRRTETPELFPKTGPRKTTEIYGGAPAVKPE